MFKPSKPIYELYRFSNDLEREMREYEKIIPDFKFVGTMPMDFWN